MEVGKAEIEMEFTSCVLFKWFELCTECSEQSLSVDVLADGTFLNDLMQQIDPRPTNRTINREVKGDTLLRVSNLNGLLQTVKSCYQDILQQLIVATLPDILLIAKNPHSEPSINEIRYLLLLILGCAVQCHRKETFIDKIQSMDLDAQREMAEYIQEITDSKYVISMDWNCLTENNEESMAALTHTILNHLKMAIKVRDDYNGLLHELSLESEFLSNGQPHTPSPSKSPPTRSGAQIRRQTSEVHHMMVELADTKGQLRRAKQEMYEKIEELSELRDELESANKTLQRLKTENMKLTGEKHSINSIRDELDVMKERAQRADKLEIECSRYRERLVEMEYHRKRVEELREDNQALFDTKALLEEQSGQLQRRIERLQACENENISLSLQIDELTTQNQKQQDRIMQLKEENTALSAQSVASLNESTNLTNELSLAISNKIPVKTLFEESPECLKQDAFYTYGHSLSAECNESSRAALLRMENENIRLNQLCDELKSRVSELDRDKVGLQRRLEQADELSNEKAILMENVLQYSPHSDESLTESVKASFERADRLAAEVEKLRKEIMFIEEREMKANEERLKAEERRITVENREIRLQEQFEKFRIDEKSRTAEKLRQEEIRLRAELSTELAARLEASTAERDHTINTLRDSLALTRADLSRKVDMEARNRSLNEEMIRMQKQLELYSEKDAAHCENAAQLKEELDLAQRESIQLKREVEKCEKIAAEVNDLEKENRKLEQDNKQLERDVRRWKTGCDKAESDLECSQTRITELERENRRLTRTAERNRGLEERLRDFEKENKELVKQTAIDRKTNNTLREELVNEKMRVQQLRSDIDLSSSDGMIRTASMRTTQHEIDANRIKELEQQLKDTLVRQRHLEKDLDQMRASYDALNIKISEANCSEETLVSSFNDKYIESEMKVYWSIKVKSIQAELDSSRSYIDVLTKQLDHVQEELIVANSEKQDLKGKLSGYEKHAHSLQGENARMQVELSTLQSKNSSLRIHQQQLQSAIQRVEAERDQMQKNLEDVTSTHDALARDHETLQGLHNNLSKDYDDVVSRYKSLKTLHKSLNSNFKELQDRFEALTTEKESLERMKISLRGQRDTLASGAKPYPALVKENEHLRQAHKHLMDGHEQLKRNYEKIKKKHDNRSQLEALEAELSRSQLQIKEFSKLTDTLRRENEHLLKKINTDTLEDIEFIDNMEDDESDRLRNLDHEKDRLEQQILTLSRPSDSPPLRKSQSKRKERPVSVDFSLVGKVWPKSFLKRAKSVMKGQKESADPHTRRLGSTEDERYDLSSQGDTESNERCSNEVPAEFATLPRKNRHVDLSSPAKLSVDSSMGKSLPDVQGRIKLNTEEINKLLSSLEKPLHLKLPGLPCQDCALLFNSPFRVDQESASSLSSIERSSSLERHHGSHVSSTPNKSNHPRLARSATVDPTRTFGMLMEGDDSGTLDELVSLEQFLEESNRSPSSRRRFHEAILREDEQELRVHLSGDELDHEPTSSNKLTVQTSSQRRLDGGSLSSTSPVSQHSLEPSKKAGVVPPQVRRSIHSQSVGAERLAESRISDAHRLSTHEPLLLAHNAPSLTKPGSRSALADPLKLNSNVPRPQSVVPLVARQSTSSNSKADEEQSNAPHSEEAPSNSEKKNSEAVWYEYGCL